MFRRATLLNESVSLLRLDYTYNILPCTNEQRENRRILGKAAADMLENMSNELTKEGVRLWMLSSENTNSG